MDFALLASDNNLNAASSFSLQDDGSKQKSFGFGFLKQDRAINEEDLRQFKMAKTRSSSSCGEGMLRYHVQRSNGCNNISTAEGHHQMLSFSSPNSQPPPSLTLPYYHYASNAFARNAVGINGGSMQGVRGPFTPSQWMELEHQALIYKYITANVPIPSYLLNPLRKAFDSALRCNPLGWSGFQLGFSNTDPEPGRCRRTDGKKWRCSRDAVVDQKYCERHMNRGRHRSRKPVEPQSNPTPTKNTKQNVDIAKEEKQQQESNPWRSSSQEFGLVCSDSLLNPLKRSSSLRQFMDDSDRTQLSISIPMPTSPTNHCIPSSPLDMGLGVGNDFPSIHRQATNWVPISWEPTTLGGPLGEVLHNSTNTAAADAKHLNLIASSPTGVLQRGPFASLSNSSAATSPRHDAPTSSTTTPCSRIINPLMPALLN